METNINRICTFYYCVLNTFHNFKKTLFPLLSLYIHTVQFMINVGFVKMRKRCKQHPCIYKETPFSFSWQEKHRNLLVWGGGELFGGWFFLYSVPAVSVKKLPKQEENWQGSHRLLNSAPCYHRQPHFIIPCIK